MQHLFDLPDCSLAHCPNHVAWWCPAYLNKVVHIQPSSLLASSSYMCSVKEVTCVLLFTAGLLLADLSQKTPFLVWNHIPGLAFGLQGGGAWASAVVCTGDVQSCSTPQQPLSPRPQFFTVERSRPGAVMPLFSHTTLARCHPPAGKKPPSSTEKIIFNF